MSVIVYSTKSFRLKSFINLVREKYIRAIALNTPPHSELAIFYDYEIILYDIPSSSTIRTYPLNFIIYLQFNTSNKLLALSSKGSVSIIDINTQSITSPKLLNQTTLAKWYPFNSTDFIYCTTSNEVCLCNYTQQSKQASTTYIKLDGYNEQHIVDVAWYDIDENYKYVLTAFGNGDIVLLDMNGVPTIINKFDRSGGGLVKVIWLMNEPGSFMSIGKNSTRVTLYNVSRKNYKSIIKLASYPIINCVCFDNSNSKVLLALDNGAVLIYDLVKYKSVFDVTPGHSETVFDLKFSPFINGCFATCAYDGFIKVWNMETNNVTLTLKVNDPGIITDTNDKSRIYALKWSPLHKDHLLSGDSRNTIRIWDISKQKQLAMHMITNSSNHKVEVIGIDWDKSTNLIYASCYNVVHVLLFEALKFNTMHTVVIGQGKLFQIKVSPHEPGTFAVSAMDSFIRMYSNVNNSNNNSNEYKQTKLLKGHTHKVFGIAFHPKENILASSSDDFKVGIWNINDAEPKAKYLLGHTSNVRQLIWLANSSTKLLCSGSWDSTTRIWNVDYMICVALINEHQSDVYGIDLNPFHPFVLGTSSRDNSIRFWNYIYKNPIDYVIAFNDYTTNKEMFSVFPMLYEQCEAVCAYKDKSKIEQAIDIGECVVNFFYYVDSAKELFDILRIVLNIKQHSDENNKLFYLTDMYSAYKSKALNLEFKYFNDKKFDYHVKKEDLVKEALDYCMKCGDWEKFCELSIEIGNWKQAVMAAPHVSMAYWEDTVKRYNAYITNENNTNSGSTGMYSENDKLTSALLVKDVETSVNALVNVNEHDNAILTWIYKAYMNNNNSSSNGNNKHNNSFFDDEYVFDDVDELLNENKDISELSKITYKIVHKYLTMGDSIKAASSLLSIKKVSECIKTLLRTNETELAFIISTITNNHIYEYDILLSLLSQQIKGNTYSLPRCMNIINTTSNYNYRYLLYTYLHNCSNGLKEPALTEYNNVYAKVTDVNIQYLHNNNYDKLLTALQSLQHSICEQLKQNANVNVNEEHVIQLLHLFNITKVMNINAIQDKAMSIQMYRCVLYCGLLMEILNHNCRSVLLLSNEIMNMKFNENQNDDEMFICGTALKLYKEVKNKDLPLTTVTSSKEVAVDLNEVFKCVEMFSNIYARKYYCDRGVNKFYFLKSETFPVNTKNICISKLRTKVIKGKVIYINGGSYTISQSEGMEMQKVISRLSFMKNEETMLICS